MAATAQSLFTAAGCFSCLGPVTAAQTMRIGQLLQILSELGVTMTPQQWMTAGACYSCLPGVSQADGIEIAMLDSVTENISGGGTIQVYTGAAPPAAPYDPTKPALYYPTGGGALIQWDGAAWV